MLYTGRYTWRHNNLINYIVNNVEKSFQVCSDIPGWEITGGGTFPVNLCVTNLKPDIVIVDSQKQQLHFWVNMSNDS